MLKQNLATFTENQPFEEDDETMKDKVKVEELKEKLENLYKKLESENN